MNRLGASTSPYLLQHKDNPVDWWEWSDGAFAEAKRRDVPILLSVGYSACHWCHVMGHDSFEDEGIAALLNANFVSIKVDREERPDIDAVYMDAVTTLTGQGGWPMTCILTPDAKPFYAGTFFPRAQFGALLQALVEAWTQRRAEVLQAGQQVVDRLAKAGSPAIAGAVDAAALDGAVLALARGFDARNGGFGGAPKFPPSMVLEFLLRNYERTGSATALELVARTCQAMARGGLYDQLGGGFARYSVDASWVVPHFEKMLYDNALLLRLYLHWWRLTGEPLAERIARETAEFLLRDLRTEQGGFASALDADADGVEGLTYVWTPAELADVLGPDEGAYAADLFAVTAAGTFEHGASTLRLPVDPDDPQRWASVRRRLFEARARRPQPSRDDKVVTAWNGLAIAALAEAGVLLGDPHLLAAAREAGELVLSLHVAGGRLRRTSRAGRAGDAAGVAEDYGNLVDGLLMLHQATAERRWLDASGELLDVVLARFAADDGGYFDTAADAEQLVRRPRDPADNAAPSGQSAVITALIGYSALTGSLVHRQAAERALASVGALGAAQPRFLGWGLAAAEALLSGPVEVAIVGEHVVGEHVVGEHVVGEHVVGEHVVGEHLVGGAAGHDAGPAGVAPPLPAGSLSSLAWRARPPGAVIVSGEPGQDGVPLLAERPLLDGAPAAYVCRGMVCQQPVATAEQLAAALRA